MGVNLLRINDKARHFNSLYVQRSAEAVHSRLPPSPHRPAGPGVTPVPARAECSALLTRSRRLNLVYCLHLLAKYMHV